jgi:membrane-associated protein
MEQIQEFFSLLLSSEKIISEGGLVLITLIVFCETGLFFAFFLPGDYLLFSAGLLTAAGVLQVPIWLLMLCIFGAAVMGNVAGYLFGRFLGHKLETMRENIFYKREYVRNTEHAFKRYGGRALIVGRFLPIIRTFAPVIAGATHMRPVVFVGYNIIGAAMWVSTLVLSGYFLGREFPEIVNYIEYIILAFIAFTSIVVIRTYLSIRKRAKNTNSVADTVNL